MPNLNLNGQPDPTQVYGVGNGNVYNTGGNGGSPVVGAPNTSNAGVSNGISPGTSVPGGGQGTLGPTGYNPNAPGVPNNPNGGTVGLSNAAAQGNAPGGYNFAPSTGGLYGQNTATGGFLGDNQVQSPTYGQYGAGFNPGVAEQEARQQWGIQNDVNYGDYQKFGDISQQYGAAGQGVLNDPRQAQALRNQAALAGGPSTGQNVGLNRQVQATDILGNAAMGNGPTAAGIQQQQGISAAMHAQLTAASNARGGAYAQAAAQQGAQQQAAGLQAGSVGQAAQLRAQEMQAAQGQYAGAAAGITTGANQGMAAQSQAASAYQQGVQGVQGQGLNYYAQQQQAYQHQSDMAAQLAQAQVANNYGLSGTALQTQTQQNIANQQQTGQEIGAGVAATGMILAAAASTGGAQAAAKGAREHGASEIEAARIGLHVGQALGMARLGPAAQHYAGADAAAARKGAMTPAEMHAHIAKLRDNGKAVRKLPGPATEPMAAHAYAAGSHLAALAKMHGRSAHA